MRHSSDNGFLFLGFDSVRIPMRLGFFLKLINCSEEDENYYWLGFRIFFDTEAKLVKYYDMFIYKFVNMLNFYGIGYYELMFLLLNITFINKKIR